jgi:predicted O-methyltransferase YrrM
MTIRQDIVGKLWHGHDPIAGFPRRLYGVEFQGWNSEHGYLVEAIDEVRPKVVVEIGVWKGGSVSTMAARMKELELDGVVIAVDTWLGASDHWLNPAFHADLRFRDGYPSLYHCFMANIPERGLENYIVPLPLDSVNALVVLKHYGIQVDVLHIDAGHDYQSVKNDLTAWWPMLRPGGVLIGDDYHRDRLHWPEVADATDDFFNVTPHTTFRADWGKCYVRKPQT